jgi:phage terminase large subunit-like protein
MVARVVGVAVITMTKMGGQEAAARTEDLLNFCSPSNFYFLTTSMRSKKEVEVGKVVVVRFSLEMFQQFICLLGLSHLF